MKINISHELVSLSLHMCMYNIVHILNVIVTQASYGVEDAEFAVVQLAQTTMRSELGKIRLDSVFQERMNLNHMIVGEL